jgi:hypothetical protein
MTTMRPQSDVDRALSLVSRGHTPTEVARITLIPRETVRDWSYGRSLRQFATACEAVGVHCTRSSQTVISVYSGEAVALLDEFVGPKR